MTKVKVLLGICLNFLAVKRHFFMACRHIFLACCAVFIGFSMINKRHYSILPTPASTTNPYKSALHHDIKLFVDMQGAF